MTKDEIKSELLKFKALVNEARKAGLSDIEITQALGLTQKPIGKETRMVLRAIQQKEVQPDARDIATKLYGDRSKYRLAYYHLNRLVDAGYLTTAR